MGKKAYIGVSDIARRAKKIYIGVNGVARKVKKAYVGVNGVARIAFSGELEKPTFTKYDVSSCGGQISNAVLHNGYLWFFSFADKKLYGINTSTGRTKTINVSVSNIYSPAYGLITLSVANGNLFITQIRTLPSDVETWRSMAYPYYRSHWGFEMYANFTGNENTLVMTSMLDDGTSALRIPSAIHTNNDIVTKIASTSGEVVYNSSDSRYYASLVLYIFRDNGATTRRRLVDYVSFSLSDSYRNAINELVFSTGSDSIGYPNMLPSFSKHNDGEMVFTNFSGGVRVRSIPNGTYEADYGESQPSEYIEETAVPAAPIIGGSNIFAGYGDETNSSYRFWFANRYTGVTTPTDITADNSNVPAEAFESESFASPRSHAYLSAYNTWLFTSQKGIIITRDPRNTDEYRYVDVSSDFVDMSRFRSVEYAPGSNVLYIVGENQNGGTVRAMSLDVSKWDIT